LFQDGGEAGGEFVEEVGGKLDSPKELDKSGSILGVDVGVEKAGERIKDEGAEAAGASADGDAMGGLIAQRGNANEKRADGGVDFSGAAASAIVAAQWGVSVERDAAKMFGLGFEEKMQQTAEAVQKTDVRRSQRVGRGVGCHITPPQLIDLSAQTRCWALLQTE